MRVFVVLAFSAKNSAASAFELKLNAEAAEVIAEFAEKGLGNIIGPSVL